MSELMTKILEIRHDLQKYRKFSDLWHEFSLVWQKLGWQQSQLRLWLAALPEIEITRPESDNPGYQIKGEQREGEGLAEAIFDIINTSGLPMPIAQLQGRLPPSFGATEPMIKVAVKSHSKLMVMGPVVRVKK
jgi:hypothetical protein